MANNCPQDNASVRCALTKNHPEIASFCFVVMKFPSIKAGTNIYSTGLVSTTCRADASHAHIQVMYIVVYVQPSLSPPPLSCIICLQNRYYNT